MDASSYNYGLANSLFRSGIHLNRTRLSETTHRDHFRLHPFTTEEPSQFHHTGTISPRADAAPGATGGMGRTARLPAWEQFKPVPGQTLLNDVAEAKRQAKEAQENAAAEAKARMAAEDQARLAEDRANAARAELQREKAEQTRQQMKDEMAAARARAMESNALARTARKAAEEENVRAARAQAEAGAAEVARKVADAKNAQMQEDMARAKARQEAMDLRAAEEAAKRAQAEGRALAAMGAIEAAKNETASLRDFADTTGLFKSKILPRDGSGQLLTTTYRDFFQPPYMQSTGQAVHVQL